MLQCSSVRLRTKIKTGKQVYHIRAETAISMAEFYHTRANMQKLSGLYEAFLKKVREDDILVRATSFIYFPRLFLLPKGSILSTFCVVGLCDNSISDSSILAEKFREIIS